MSLVKVWHTTHPNLTIIEDNRHGQQSNEGFPIPQLWFPAPVLKQLRSFPSSLNPFCSTCVLRELIVEPTHRYFYSDTLFNKLSLRIKLTCCFFILKKNIVNLILLVFSYFPTLWQKSSKAFKCSFKPWKGFIIRIRLAIYKSCFTMTSWIPSTIILCSHSSSLSIYNSNNVEYRTHHYLTLMSLLKHSDISSLILILPQTCL